MSSQLPARSPKANRTTLPEGDRSISPRAEQASSSALEGRVGHDNAALRHDDADSRTGRLYRLWESVQPAPSLENSGSVARDHLANERTWLAYVRTSLSLASAGVAVVQFFTISTATSLPSQKLHRFVRPIGGAVVIIGWVTLLIGTWRYFRVQSSLQGGKFPPARRFVGFLSTSLGVFVAITFAVLLEIARTK